MIVVVVVVVVVVMEVWLSERKRKNPSTTGTGHSSADGWIGTKGRRKRPRPSRHDFRDICLVGAVGMVLRGPWVMSGIREGRMSLGGWRGLGRRKRVGDLWSSKTGV